MNIDGYFVRTIDATKVDYLLCKIDGSNKTFKVRADHVSCKIDFPIQLIPGEKTRKIVLATINRFPLLVNHATTGHKLQGQTKTNVCISDWHYGANWPYVVLSRVTTVKGLFLLKPLRTDNDFSHDNHLIRMLNRMRQKTPALYCTILIENGKIRNRFYFFLTYFSISRSRTNARKLGHNDSSTEKRKHITRCLVSLVVVSTLGGKIDSSSPNNAHSKWSWACSYWRFTMKQRKTTVTVRWGHKTPINEPLTSR